MLEAFRKEQAEKMNRIGSVDTTVKPPAMCAKCGKKEFSLNNRDLCICWMDDKKERRS